MGPKVWDQCGSRVNPRWIQGGTTRQAAETQSMSQLGTLEEAEEAGPGGCHNMQGMLSWAVAGVPACCYAQALEGTTGKLWPGGCT